MTDRYRTPTRRAGPELVIRKLRHFAPLTSADENLIQALDDWRHDPPGVELVRATSQAPPRLLIAGWAARVRWLTDGRRQILGFVLPGDGVALCRRPHPMSLCAMVALTPVQTLDAAALMQAVAIGPNDAPLSVALHVGAALDEQALMDQVVRMGRMTAYERIAHLISELRLRMLMVGLGAGEQYPFPLTQEMLADATGLSIVHVNRTLQQIRRERLIDLHTGRLLVRDPQMLAAVCDFKPPSAGAWKPK